LQGIAGLRGEAVVDTHVLTGGDDRNIWHEYSEDYTFGDRFETFFDRTTYYLLGSVPLSSAKMHYYHG
jgi:hypothetical protein